MSAGRLLNGAPLAAHLQKAIREPGDDTAEIEADRARYVVPFTTSTELYKATPPTVDWVQELIAARGALSLVVGKQKEAGKTTMVLAALRAGVRGDSFLGRPTRKLRAIYVTEQQPWVFAVQLQAAGLSSDDVLIVYRHGPGTIGLPWERFVEGVLNLAQQFGAEIVVFDTWADVAGVEDENESNAHLSRFAAVRPLLALGIAVILVCHERKSGGSLIDRVRGHGELVGLVDHVVGISRVGTSRLRKFEFLGRLPVPEFPIEAELIDGRYELVENETDAPHMRRDCTEDLAARVFGAVETPRSAEEIAKHLGVRVADVRRHAHALESTGTVTQTGTGKKGDPRRYMQKFPSRFPSQETPRDGNPGFPSGLTDGHGTGMDGHSTDSRPTAPNPMDRAGADGHDEFTGAGCS